MMTDVRETLIRPQRYFFKGQTFEEKHFEGLPLRLRKTRKNFACQPSCLLELQPGRRPKTVLFFCLTEFNLLVKLPHKQVISAVHAPAIRVLKKPHFKCPSCAIELSQSSINFQENRLRYILGFAGIPQYVDSGHVDEAMVAFEDDGERICIIRTHLLDEAFIAELQQFRVGDAAVTLVRT
jgi:hypothetical protein